MLEAGQGLKTLLDDVITLTHDESHPADEGCDPAMAARAVVRLVQPRALEKHLRLNVTAIGELPLVAADARTRSPGAAELIDNAVKFTDAGSVDVRIERVVALRITLHSVCGFGHGPRHHGRRWPRLFKPFSPGGPLLHQDKQGAGLGLAVAKRIVELLGGKVRLRERACGRFDVLVHAAGSRVAPAQTPMAPPVELEVAPVAGANILIFAPEAQAQVADMVEPFGNKLTVALDIQEASHTRAAARSMRSYFGARDTATVATSGADLPILSLVAKDERGQPAGARQILALARAWLGRVAARGLAVRERSRCNNLRRRRRGAKQGAAGRNGHGCA